MRTLLLASDTQLVKEFKEGNNKALEVLIWRHKEKIFSSILFLVKDRHLAEDIFQDTFIKIIESIWKNSYSDEGRFSSYAIRVAHNICIDHFRKATKVKLVDAEDNNNVVEMANTYDEAADKNIIQLETSDRVKQLLDKLPEDQREVIVLRHFADFTFKEIAEITNCNINTALGRMRYGLLNMRKMLDQKEVA
jgi:RNA polymerase sigma-70 factor (ECF subfamily)